VRLVRALVIIVALASGCVRDPAPAECPHTSFLAAAAVDVEACGTLIDRVTYDVLPDMGTYSLGAQPPSADNNDLPAMWCTDATNLAGTYPGTPQHANLACP
jgi:hypothetical protein